MVLLMILYWESILKNYVPVFVDKREVIGKIKRSCLTGSLPHSVAGGYSKPHHGHSCLLGCRVREKKRHEAISLWFGFLATIHRALDPQERPMIATRRLSCLFCDVRWPRSSMQYKCARVYRPSLKPLYRTQAV